MLTFLLAGCSSDAPEPKPPAGPPPTLAERCFGFVEGRSAGDVPDYQEYDALVPEHCTGTGQQHVEDLDRIVFAGDSITTGTPPTPVPVYYRNLLVASLSERYGHPIETQDCSRWGARVDDLVQDDVQLDTCLGLLTDPPDDRRTLLVFTVGGNDMFEFAQDVQGGGTVDELDADVAATVSLFGEALDHLVAQRARFPNGLSVVFGNVYEFTDGTGDLGVCPSAEILGFDEPIPEIRDAYVRVNEAWVAAAVDHGFDVVFLLEHFCGHGFLAGDPSNECYRGEDATTWFDGTCIHPNPEGHQVMAAMFEAVIAHGERPGALTPLVTP